MIIDSHCHLNDEVFNNDIYQVLQNMIQNNVKKACLISLSLKDYSKALNIKHKEINFSYSLGVFPTDYNISEEEFKKYQVIMESENISAIGEIGLDYHYENQDKEKQKSLFIRQILIANSLNKPILVHSRDACQDTLDIIKTYNPKGVMHCFSGSKEIAKEYIKLGFMLSFSGVITFKNANNLKEVVKAVPIENILIETDSPYLAPVPYRGKRNEPSYVVETLKMIAELKNIDINELEKQIERNYNKIFNIKEN